MTESICRFNTALKINRLQPLDCALLANRSTAVPATLLFRMGTRRGSFLFCDNISSSFRVHGDYHRVDNVRWCCWTILDTKH